MPESSSEGEEVVQTTISPDKMEEPFREEFDPEGEEIPEPKTFEDEGLTEVNEEGA